MHVRLLLHSLLENNKNQYLPPPRRPRLLDPTWTGSLLRNTQPELTSIRHYYHHHVRSRR